MTENFDITNPTTNATESQLFSCVWLYLLFLNNRKYLGKFQAKSDKGIFLGYSLNNRTYRIYNLHTKTIMESINVVVDDIAEILNED